MSKKFQLVAIEKLVPYANNARKHSAEQINKLRGSLREFGFINPVIIDKDFGIIAGHGRVLAAQAENIAEVPCVLVDHLTEAQKKAYIIADNRLALDADWDEELLRIEIEALKDLDFDVSFTGFDDDEIAALSNLNFDEIQEDNFDVEAELQKPCITKEGDNWTLGRHKVICADTTQADTYKKLLGTKKVNLVVTDPPYLVAYENESGTIANDDLNDTDGYKFLYTAFENFRDAMTRDASIYIFYASVKARIVHDAFEDAGFKVGAGLIWKKDSLVLSRTDWKYIHEPLVFGWAKDGVHKWYGDNKQVTVFDFDRIKNSKTAGFSHPSSKPVPLLAYLIKLSSKAKDSVLDGFLGSASTLVACEMLGRTCYGIELMPKFVDVAIERYAAMTDTYENISVERDGKIYSYDEVKNI